MSAIQGYPHQQKHGPSQFQTIQRIGLGGAYGSDVVPRGVYSAASETVAASPAPKVGSFTSTSTAAKAGDLIRFTSGANSNIEIGVLSVVADLITLVGNLPVAPSASDAYTVLRFVTPTYSSSGGLSVTSGPLAIKVDGVATDVNFNSGTPASSVAVPVYITGGGAAASALDYGVSSAAARTASQIGNASGAADFAAGNSSAQTLRVVVATNQAAIAVSGPLTDTQLRATAVPVSGPLTDTQLRATAVPVSAAALPLPTGAATESTLSTLNGKVPSNLTVTSTRLLVDGSGVTQPISAAALPLPTGASTAAKQPALGTAGSASSDVITVQGIANGTALPVSASPGRAKANAPTRNDYTSVNVTTAAYVTLIASTTSAASLIEVFDSSGQTLKIATGAAASEVDQFIVFPGGNGQIPLAIPAGTRISIKALSATASVGEIDINLYT